MAGVGEPGDTVLWTSDGTVNSSPQNDVGDAFVAVVHAVESRDEEDAPAVLTLALLVPGISSVLWKHHVPHGAGDESQGLRTVTGQDGIPRRQLVRIPAPMGTWRRTDE
jgi:hypothetical protein